jgi:hypothetical protein
MRRLIVISFVLLVATTVGVVTSVATSGPVQPPALEKADAKPPAKQAEDEGKTGDVAPEGARTTDSDSPCISIVVNLTDSLELPGLACADVRVELSPSVPEDCAPLILGSDGRLAFTTPCHAPAFERWLQTGVRWNVKVGLTLGWHCDSEDLFTNIEVSDPAVGGERRLCFEIPADTSALLGGNVLLRGRVTHSSGHVFIDRDIGLRRPLWENAYVATRTGPDGGFSVLERAWANNTTEAKSGDWGIQVLGGGDGRMRGVADCFSAGRPAWEGNVLDFGSIVLGGGLLKASAQSSHEDDVCTLDLRSGSYESNVSLPAFLLLLPGRYFWSTHSAVPVRGWVDVVDGQLTELLVELVAPQYLRVFVDGLPEDGFASIFAQTAENEGPWCIAAEEASPVTVLTNGMTDLRIHAATDELESDVVAVPVGAEQVTLTLSNRREQPERPSPERIVVRFHAPEGLQLNPSIVCECDDGTRVSRSTRGEFWFANVEDYVEAEQQEDTYDCAAHPGTWEVSVYGGAEYGYEGGRLSGPVTVVVSPGVDVTVEMLDPGPPPRSSPGSLFLRFACEGAGIELHAPLKLHDGSRVFSQWWNSNEPLPVALLDGSAEIALGTDDSDPVHVSVGANLPSRVHVRAQRATGGLRAQLWSLAESWPRPSCSANLVDGEVSLWLPAGPAHLVVTRDGDVVHETDVDVPVEGTLEVEFENSSGLADFTRDSRMQDTHWHLFRQVASGWEVVELYFSAARRMLPAGRYAAVSCSASWFGVAGFDIREGEETPVKLTPQTGYKRGPVALNLPPTYLGEDGALRIDVVPAGISEYGLDAASLKRVARSVSVRMTREGATVTDMPLGGEFILVGSVCCDGVTYALRQFVTVPDGASSVTVNWHEYDATDD